MTPRCVGFAVSALRYMPIVAGVSHVARVRSGLIFCQLLPPLDVLHSVFDAKYMTCGSTPEKTTGAVRSVRKSAGRTGVGAMFWTCAIRRSYRVIFPPKMMFGFSGSGTAYPYSSTPTGCHSRKVIIPSLPRLDTHADPLSCCPPHTRYGNALSAFTWYICDVGWLYQELQVSPPLTLTIAPWSLASAMMFGLFGL